jgi:hypothetical protein
MRAARTSFIVDSPTGAENITEPDFVTLRSDRRAASFGGESQRDSASKPRVARNELPWVKRNEPFNANGVASFWNNDMPQLLFGPNDGIPGVFGRAGKQVGSFEGFPLIVS